MAFPFNYPNQRGHPFWDFVASMDDMNDRRPPNYAPPAHENETYKAPTAEDEKMADADAGPAKRDATGNEKTSDGKEKDKARDEGSDSSASSSDDGPCCERRRCRRRCDKGRHWGPPPFGPWAFPGFLGPEGPRDMPEWGPPHPRHAHHRGPPRDHDHPRGRHHGPPPPGPPPPAGAHPGEHPPPPPHAEFGPRHNHRGRHHGHGGPCGGRGGPFGGRGGPFGGRGGPFGGRGGPFGRRGHGPDFNVPAFLSQLGDRLGVDLNAAAANFGVDLSRFTAAGNSEADFVPHHDLFDLIEEYLIHVSLPGAQREDIGLDFDGEHSTLRVGGVVYRPGIDENLNSSISHSGRNSEVGVFETKIRLPSHGNDLIEIAHDAISAKLRDGILVIHVPKIHKKKDDLKRSVRIDTPSPSPERGAITSNLAVREKDTARNDPFASDHKENEKTLSPHRDGDLYHSTPGTEKGDQEKTAADTTMDDSADPPEQLPEYTPSHPDDDDDEEQEGEYVKINVN